MSGIRSAGKYSIFHFSANANKDARSMITKNNWLKFTGSYKEKCSRFMMKKEVSLTILTFIK